MDLKTYIATSKRGTAKRLAEHLNVSPSYLSQMAADAALRSPARCVEIESATGGAVTRKDLRPTDWMAFWPELADKDAA